MFRKINSIIIFSNIFILFFTCICAKIRPTSNLYVTEGEGFVAYLEVNENFGSIKNCLFQFKDEDAIPIDLTSTTLMRSTRGEEILPFSATVCGLRVNKVSAVSVGVWKLTAQNALGSNETGSFSLSLNTARKVRFQTHIQRDVGQGYISCQRSTIYTQYCQIIDSDGNVWNTCSINTILRPNMTFECLTYNSGRLADSHELVIVEKKITADKTASSQEDTENNMILRCQALDNLSKCHAQKPGGKTGILVMEGLYDGRISSYDTLASASRCSLDIPKPFRNDEVGLWRFTNNDDKYPAGCIFYVGEDKQTIIEKELKIFKKIQEISVYTEDKQINELSTTVPFLITDCYLRDPNNTIYYPDAFLFEYTRQYGLCSITNLPVLAGNWVFGVRGPDYDNEVTQDVLVDVKSQLGEVLTKDVEVRARGSMELMCKSPFGEPLSKCAFIDPQNQVHLVATEESTKTAGHAQYFGRGLLQGECGIKIENINKDDFGNWKCQFTALLKTSSFNMFVREAPLGQARAFGLVVGFVTILIFIGSIGIGTIFYRRRNMSAQHTFTSRASFEMNRSTGTNESIM